MLVLPGPCHQGRGDLQEGRAWAALDGVGTDGAVQDAAGARL